MGNDSEIIGDDSFVDELILNPEERGFLIELRNDNYIADYYGKKGHTVKKNILKHGNPVPALSELDFMSESDAMTNVKNYLACGKDARMIFCFRYNGNTYIDHDATDDYKRINLI